MSEPATIKHLSITLRHLRAFVIVAQLGSFKLAAERLSRTQPSITLAVQQLEESIGLKLLERTTRKVVPTQEGEKFIPIAARLLRDFDIAISDLTAVAERRTGHVSMAVLPSVATRLLPEVVNRFSQEYPGISVHMADDNSRTVQQSILRNEIDFGIAGGSIKHNDLEYRPLIQDRVELVCHKDHPLAASRSPIEWRELRPYRFLDSGLHDMAPAKDLITEPRYEFSTTTLLFAMIRQNVGVTVLPSLANRAEDADIFFRPLIRPVIKRDVFLITRKESSLSAAGEAMVEVLYESLPKIVARLGNENIKCLAGKKSS